MRVADAPTTPDAVDAESLLRELARRWSGSRTLEYRSQALLNHAGEWRILVHLHVQLRRPNLARLTFDADRAEMTRIRVCDGRRIWDFPKSTPLRPGRTVSQAFYGTLTANIPHPLDDVSYCVDQFFAPFPFLPAGLPQSPGFRLRGARERGVTVGGRTLPEVLRIIIERGGGKYDRLTLEPISLRPLELVRVADHGGRLQEILRETFEEVSLGANLPPSLFTWTPADDRGETVP